MKPSEQQEKIFKGVRLARQRRTKGKNSNFIIRAVAGSGKSTTLRGCVQQIKDKYPRDSVIVLQFNRHIAEEMAAKLVDGDGDKYYGVDVKTTHQAGLQVLRNNNLGAKGKAIAGKYYLIAKELIEKNHRSAIIDHYKPAGIEKSRMTKEQISTALKKGISQLTEISKFSMLTLSGTEEDALRAMIAKHDLDCSSDYILPLVKKVVDTGIDAVRNRTMLSFEDMICAPILLDCKFPQYDWVLVDECQDLNAAQLEMVLRFSKNGFRGAFGDSRQAIMAFSGSMSDGTDKFIEMTQARELPLTICYRCDSKILELARYIVPDIADRPDCGEGIAEAITKDNIALKAEGGDYVLCRITAPLVSMCIGFIKIGKSAKVKGRDIGKKLIDVYQTIVDVSDCRTVDQFIGATKDFRESEMQRAITKKLPQHEVMRMTDEFDCIEAIAFFVAEKAKGAVVYHDAIKKQIDTLFEDEIGKQFITLCTVHRAKGLEANRVFIIEFDKMPFIFPGRQVSKEQMTQEHNLIYVAITRAMKELYIQGNGIAVGADIHSKLKSLTGGLSCATLPLPQESQLTEANPTT